MTVKQKLKEYKQLTEEQRKQIMTKIDELQINLSLGKADTEQKIIEQKQKIMSHVKALEQIIDQYLQQKSAELTGHMVHASDKLNAEFAALEIFFSIQGKKAKENFSSNKEKLINQLHQFKHQLTDKSNEGARKSLQFEQELVKGLKTIKNAFIHLKD